MPTAANPSRPVGYIEGWYVTEDHATAAYAGTHPSPDPLLRSFYSPHFTPRYRTFDVLVCCPQGFLLAVVDEIRRGDDSVVFSKDVKAPHERYLSQSTFQPPGKPGLRRSQDLSARSEVTTTTVDE